MTLRYLTAGVVLVAVLSLFTSPALAVNWVTVENTASGHTFSLPEQAVEHAPDVFSLGTAVDPDTGKLVEGYAIVHRGNDAKPDNPGNGNGKGNGGNGGGSSCYGYIANGANWKTYEDWVVNPANSEGISDADVFAIVDESINKWEDAADGTVGDSSFLDIFGVGSTTTDALAAGDGLNGLNEVVFGSVDSPGAIAVTVVWGIFSGPKFNRELVEWDQIYDEVDFDWSVTGAANAMDFDNIVTHEMGHSFGMADLYEASCANETMYGYAGNGETDKRDLEAEDITGISKLY